MDRTKRVRRVVIIVLCVFLSGGIVFFICSSIFGKDKLVIRREYGLLGISGYPYVSLDFEAYAIGSSEYDKFEEGAFFRFDNENIVINKVTISRVRDVNDVAVCRVSVEAEVLNTGEYGISELVYEHGIKKTKYDIGDIEIVYSDLEGRLPHVNYTPYMRSGSETTMTLRWDEGFVITGVLSSEKYPVRMVGSAYRSVGGEEVEVCFVPEFSAEEGDVLIYRPLLYMTTEAGTEAVVSFSWSLSDETEMTEEQIKEYMEK